MKHIADNPIKLCNQPKSKYLGDVISESGLSESVQCTVNKRIGTVSRAIYEIRSVLNNCRAHLVGGLVSGFEMWEIAVIPMLLYNSETWMEISKKTIDISK